MNKQQFHQFMRLSQSELDYILGKSSFREDQKQELELLRLEYELAGRPTLETFEEVVSLSSPTPIINAVQAKTEAAKVHSLKVQIDRKVMTVLKQCDSEIKKACALGMFVARVRGSAHLDYEQQNILTHELRKNGFEMKGTWQVEHDTIYEISWL